MKIFYKSSELIKLCIRVFATPNTGATRRAILSGQGDVIDGLDTKELVEIKEDR